VEPAAIHRYPLAGSLYDVRLSPSDLTVRRDDRPLFATDAPVEIRQIRFQGSTISFETRAFRPSHLLDLGRRRIAFIGGPNGSVTSGQRELG
jgi:hypothetical protein